MKAQEIRDKFVEYFKKNQHEKIPSSSLIPHNDDTLLFTNAGMNQFKDYFTGKINPENKRAVTIQKCVRAGGKHNDLDNVGFTARHHTFFEMLGNFSFGDYFKTQAISMAWEFLTKELKLPAEKLYVTVHHTDDEAFKIWNEEIGVDANKIFRKGDKDNFWEMGELGPCGPCSEIFYDHGESYNTPNFKPSEGQDILDDELRYVEIWNLVFMQYEKTPEGRIDLPNPSIDTGAGLERLCAVLQGKYWNYDTDVFAPIFEQIEKITGKSYQNKTFQSSMRVVADHIRSCTMLLTDGVIPSNEGRGYVLRRIIRRAVRHLKELDAPAGSFSSLIPSVFEKLGQEYPQNQNNLSTAQKFLELEENKFLETLDQGLKYLGESIKKDIVDNQLSGSSAFKLYDTYGFPIDLTETILRERGIEVDYQGFNSAMQQRREESKKSWKGGTQIDDRVYHNIKKDHGSTHFVGYERLETSSELKQIIDIDEERLGLIFQETPFYGESGGQVGDRGKIIKDEDVVAYISDTQKPIDALHVHIIQKSESDKLAIGEKYLLKVDEKKRRLTARNHSATHLLQAALIKTLGDHVKQAGSYVDDKRLRFDFTHMQALSSDEIAKTERLINEQILQAYPVLAENMTMDEALNKGALAMFGEKYGDEVRVLQMGSFSTELCGGTHVTNTSEIGLFKIISESSLAAGVRRIEATTSETAISYLNERSQILANIEKLLKTNSSDVTTRIELLNKEIKTLKKEARALNEKMQSQDGKKLFSQSLKVKGIDFVAAEAPSNTDPKKLSDNFAQQYPKGILLLMAKRNDKMQVLLRSSGLKEEIDCAKILKETLSMFEGKGGGRHDMAQGSGKIDDTKELQKKVLSLIESNL